MVSFTTINVSVQNNVGFLPDIMVKHIARVWINRVRLANSARRQLNSTA